LNPYFPNNLRILYIQIAERSLKGIEVGVNLEWVPLSSWALFLSSWGVFVFVFAALLFILMGSRTMSSRTLLLFCITLMFLFTFSRFARGVDQFVPFAVLFSASAFQELRMEVHRGMKAAAVLCVNCFTAWRDLRSIDAVDNAGSALWLKENSRQSSTVFLVNYGSFPQLLYYNRYTLGLDPVFAKALDPDQDAFSAVFQLR